MAVAAAVLALGGCSDATGPGTQFRDDLICSIPQNEILPGGPGRDGIPALTDPDMVEPAASGASYLADDARVIGIEVADRTYAIPLNILWWHEIVNLNLGEVQLAVSHCPLTGSSMVFDRAVVGGAEFGVSGLLFRNNLIMYDRNTDESLWPQMMGEARCGPRDGTELRMLPALEMRWLRWRRLHPDTRVVSDHTGHMRDYNSYPYGDYAELNNSNTLFAMPPLDERRPPKERVLGIPAGEGGLAFPFGLLSEAGPLLAVHREVAGRPLVVFWNQTGRSAMAFQPEVGGQSLTFTTADGSFVDGETGSVWTEEGQAVDGPLAGERLPPVAEAFVAYWFAWAAFYPATDIWDGTS